jgi:histidine decarboxylase
LQKNNIQYLLNPYSITVVIPKPNEEIIKKYQLACKDEMAHVVVMQHVSRNVLHELVEDLIKEDIQDKKLILS